MREGQTETRDSIPQVLTKPQAFGVGAVEGLRGEIVICDGRCWIGEVVAEAGDSILRVREDQSSPRATLLVVAYVPTWSETTIERPLASDEIVTHVREAAQRAGMDATRPFPFVIEGEFRDFSAHVINGYCPLNQGADARVAENQPIRVDRQAVRGKLIGFYAENSAGELTHHGSNMHIHFLTDSSPRAVAHVEQVAAAPSARLLLPAR